MMRGFYLLAMRKRRQKRFAAAACVLAALSAFFAVGTYGKSQEEVDAPLPVSAAGTEPETFVALNKEGRVVVFRGNELVMRTGIDVRTLPEADRVKLDEGITLYSEESLARLLEDYTG